MSRGSSSVLHNLVNTFNIDALPSENVLTATLEITTATVEEGSPVQGKVKRTNGAIDVAFTVRVTLTGLAAASLPVAFAPIDVTVAAGQSEATFSFSTVEVAGSVQACTGTLTLSGTGVFLGSPYSGTFSFTDKAAPIPALPIVTFADLPTLREVNESMDHSLYIRVHITRTVPPGTTDAGLTVYWAKSGYDDADDTRYARSGRTVFAVGVLSANFDVEAENVLADRTITSTLQADTASPATYQIGAIASFDVTIKNVTSGGGGGDYTGDDWYKSTFTQNAAGAYVSKYTRNIVNIGPNFFSSSEKNDWVDYMGDLDMVDGSACWSWRSQNWEEYIGGPRSNGASSIDSNSWLNLYQSGHVKYWWDLATSHPDLWCVLNCVSMPNAQVDDKHNDPPYDAMRITAAQQIQIIDDIIAGRKDDDLVMLGKRLRYAIEHQNGGSRAGVANANRVLLRINWEWQHTTSLRIASTKGNGNKSFMDQMIAEGKATGSTTAEKYLAAVKIYRDMMHKWCIKVKEGYKAGWASDTPAATLRIALSSAMMTHRGFLMQEMISPDSYNSTTDSTDDYDVWDMMYHANQDNASTYQELWDIFYTASTSGKYRHANSLIAAEYWNLPYSSLETGPTFTMQNATSPAPAFGPVDSGDPYFADKGFNHPPTLKLDTNAEVVGLNHYRYVAATDDIYQCIAKGSGKATSVPNHTSGEHAYPDGYTWVWRYNKSRKLTLGECSELFFRDFYLLKVGSRGSFVGSFNPTSCNDSYTQSTWSRYNRDRNSSDTAAEVHSDSDKQDWKRFVQMRKAMLFGKK